MGDIGATASETGHQEPQQFALKWNDFHKSITTTFRDLRDEEDFVDVTIACEGFVFLAHKVVLSACSPYFRSLLKSNPCQHPIIIVHAVRQPEMEALLRFMYNGEVNIGEDRLNDFLKTAQTLQVRGLADVSSKDQHKLSNMSSSIPWSTGDASQSVSASKRSISAEIRNHSPTKKARHSPNQNSRYTVSPPVNRDSISSDNADGKPSSLSDSVHSLQQNDERSQSAQNSHPDDSGDESYDDEASDAEMDPNDIGNSSAHDLPPPHAPDFAMSDRSKNDSLVLFDQQRQQTGFSQIPFALQSFPDLANFIPGLQLRGPNSQDNYGLRKNSDGKVRATDPRPCPKCKKIYRSAHTLRTHMDDKHTLCPGYRCVLCGTVAKSRNSLHSHMSRQHRGISTKELPVLPMPAPFDPELASQLFRKAGITVTPEELRARASPPSTAVAPLPRPDTRVDVASSDNNSESPDDDPQDLSINSNRRYRAQQKAFSAIDFHNASVNDKMVFNSLISSFLPTMVGMNKENLDS